MLKLLDDEEDLKDDIGMTALMYATKDNRFNAAEALFITQAGRRAHDGTTAFMLAVENENRKIAEMLREREIGMQKTDGTTSLMIAASRIPRGCEASY